MLVRLRLVGGWVGVMGFGEGPLVVGHPRGYRFLTEGASGGDSRGLSQGFAFAACALGENPIVLRSARRRETPTASRRFLR